jgi:hypothetical protein
MLAALACLGLPGLGKKHQHGGRSLKELRDGLERVSHKVELLKELQHSSLEPLADEEPDTEPGNDYQLAQVQSEGSVLSLEREREESLVKVAKEMYEGVENCEALAPPKHKVECKNEMDKIRSESSPSGQAGKAAVWEKMVTLLQRDVCATNEAAIVWGDEEKQIEREGLDPESMENAKRIRKDPSVLTSRTDQDDPLPKITTIKKFHVAGPEPSQPTWNGDDECVICEHRPDCQERGVPKVGMQGTVQVSVQEIKKLGSIPVCTAKNEAGEQKYVLPLPVPPECTVKVTEQKISIPVIALKRYKPDITTRFKSKKVTSKRKGKTWPGGSPINKETESTDHYLRQAITPEEGKKECDPTDNKKWLDLFFSEKEAAPHADSPEELTIHGAELPRTADPPCGRGNTCPSCPPQTSRRAGAARDTGRATVTIRWAQGITTTPPG